MYLIILVVIFLSAVQYLVRAHHFLNFQNYYCKIYFENYRICYLFLIVKVFLTASFGLYKIWNTYYRMLNLRVKIRRLSESWDFSTSRDSSVGRASDWRSEGPWFDPWSRHNFIFTFPIKLIYFNSFLKYQFIREIYHI